ncbi:UDP-N-acetylglucosamine 4,6-dehydratase family protein [Duncaniella muricolitica]|jgi:FlaA1/EpsC-like NDP-sugar epimerase|uniref:UDP-N-acetylglucosamine 4,6-dehydratase family protein n=1 Tax=Duncaniella muricolitica TaxID=2880704 RepID=UPI00244DFFE3|nr:polysaccharide biosynthesis protein [Duncaniella muricolitica]
MFTRLLTWYTSRSALPFWLILIADCLTVFLSGVLAYVVDYSASMALSALGPLSLTLAVYLCCYIIGFRLFHTYSGIIRKTSVADLARVWLALLTGVCLVMTLRYLAGTDRWLMPFRLRDLLMQTVIASILMTGLRATAKLFYDLYVRRLTGGGAYGYSDKDLISMEMADLLQREPIEVNMSGITRALGGRSILVTGAAGSIGSELSMLLASCRPSQLVLIDQAESPLHSVRIELERLYPDLKCATIVTNICHTRRMEKIFAAYRPEYVFHAAAYKHVPMMEDNPVESVLNNVDGTRKIADLAVRYGVGKFVMISTDKAVNPTSVMGCSKRICEMYCQSLSEAQTATQFITTRFGNVLGSNGSVIPTFRDQIRRGGPVLVTHPDIIRYFMLISEACSLVLEAATIGRGGEIFAFDMGSPVRILDLARRMIILSGRLDVPIKFTGLRPGEKLYEEVLADARLTRPTIHPKIKVAIRSAALFADVSADINTLIETALTHNDTDTVRIMKRMVPEYKSPPNTPYSLLDTPRSNILRPSAAMSPAIPSALTQQSGIKAHAI